MYADAFDPSACAAEHLTALSPEPPPWRTTCPSCARCCRSCTGELLLGLTLPHLQHKKSMPSLFFQCLSQCAAKYQRFLERCVRFVAGHRCSAGCWPASSHEGSQASSAAQPSTRTNIKNLKLQSDVYSRCLEKLFMFERCQEYL